MENIKEESSACLKNEPSQQLYSTDLQTDERLPHTIVVQAEVSNVNIEEGVSLDGSKENSTSDKISLPSKTRFTSIERKVLSPIASSTSISAMGDFSSKEQDEGKGSSERENKDGSVEDTRSEFPNSPANKALPTTTARSTPRPLPPPHFRRTGKRAFSESEAQNFSLITRNTTNIPTSLVYWTGDRSTRSEHNYVVTNKVNPSTSGPKISLISGSQQETTYVIEPQLSGLCTSVTSVSSGGSWAENPGKKIVDSLRKRPQLLDNDALNNMEGIQKALPSANTNISLGQEITKHNPKPISGLFSKSEGKSASGTFGNSGTFGVGRRRDSLAQKFQSLDYRLKLRYQLNSRSQGKCIINLSLNSSSQFKKM